MERRARGEGRREERGEWGGSRRRAEERRKRVKGLRRAAVLTSKTRAEYRLSYALERVGAFSSLRARDGVSSHPRAIALISIVARCFRCFSRGGDHAKSLPRERHDSVGDYFFFFFPLSRRTPISRARTGLRVTRLLDCGEVYADDIRKAMRETY